MSGPFRGFPVEGLDFYDDLETDNSRSFWAKNKQTYLDVVRAPMEALLSELEPDFGPGKAFRPYRDLRYSNDPTPYKTHQGGFVATSEACGFYVQVDAAGLLTGAGWYHAAGPAVTHFREAVDDEATGTKLARIVGRLVRAGFEIGGDQLKTRPRGYDSAHPRIELLRHRSLIATRRYDGTQPWLHTAEAGGRVHADWRALRPLVDWFGDHVAATPG